MKIWQVKADALRLMFADSGLTFSEAEFRDGVLMNNGNTRQYLIGMEESMRRGIDMYYDYVGQPTKSQSVFLSSNTVAEVTTYSNELDISGISDFGFPSRIDYETYNDDDEKLLTSTQIGFSYDQASKKIYFMDEDYTEYGDTIKFIVWYKADLGNIPYDADEIDYELNDISLPEKVQRMLPYYIKGELFEEAEPSLASQSLGRYIGFLRSLRKPFGKVQTKVKRSRVFTKTN